MELEIIKSLFFILLVALVGGLAMRLLKLPSLIGYILAGIFGGLFLPIDVTRVEALAELGVILLLFSVGLELSLSKLVRVGKIAFFGAFFQILLVLGLSFVILSLFGFSQTSALVLAAGFSLSSTAVVVKILSDRGETETIHGEIMIGWLLVQDLAVIPMVVLLPYLSGTLMNGGLVEALQSVLVSIILIAAVFLLGRLIAPFVVHRIASLNSREILILASVSLALGTAFLVSLFGISPAIGAFLAGVVASESQENHAIFSETRPLRDLFVILFFVSLGFLISPQIVFANLILILALAGLVLFLKVLIVFLILLVFNYHGKTNIASSIGLAQVGEFSFVLFLSARELKILDQETASIGIAVTLVTLMITPLLFKCIIPIWRRTKDWSRIWPFFHKLVVGWKKSVLPNSGYNNHIIICGYGRVGRWIGEALSALDIHFVVIDYNQKILRELKEKGIPVIYGDPAEPEVLEMAGVREAKSVVIAIPDVISQEEVITYTQTVAPDAKLIARAHFDEDWARLSQMKVNRVVQPEFEGALAMVKEIFSSMGKNKNEIIKLTKSLRMKHSLKR